MSSMASGTLLKLASFAASRMFSFFPGFSVTAEILFFVLLWTDLSVKNDSYEVSYSRERWELCC